VPFDSMPVARVRVPAATQFAALWAARAVFPGDRHSSKMGYSRELALKKIQEYLQHAADCREMARTATAAHRQQLEQMAETWEQLAQSRQRELHMSGNSDGLTVESELPPEDGPSKQ
jgi:hypothetical protein